MWLLDTINYQKSWFKGGNKSGSAIAFHRQVPDHPPTSTAATLPDAIGSRAGAKERTGGSVTVATAPLIAVQRQPNLAVIYCGRRPVQSSAVGRHNLGASRAWARVGGALAQRVSDMDACRDVCVLYVLHVALDGVSWVQSGSVESQSAKLTAYYRIGAVICSLPRASLRSLARFDLLSGECCSATPA